MHNMAVPIIGRAAVKESVPGFRPLHENLVSKSDNATTLTEQWRLEAPLRYCHLAADELQLVDTVLRGWCPLEGLPNIKSRIVRIFISSTFSDMAWERNKLMATVFPKLKAYTRERYGVEFQTVDMSAGAPPAATLEQTLMDVVDMRWGIPADAWKSHSTTEVCLSEIRNCRKHSIGPFFVVFLGQRYGTHCLSAEMAMEEYENIRKALRSSGEDVTLLDSWYLKDSNSQPPVYVLQPVDVTLGVDRASWQKICVKLDDQIIRGAAQCVAEGKLPEKALEKYKASVTELEVMEAFGISSTQEEADRNCVCFTRNISDLEHHLDRVTAASFTDQFADRPDVDKKKRDAINDLRNKRVRGTLSRENIIEESISWRDPGGVDPEYHKNYLEKLSIRFYERIRSLIDMNVVLAEGTEKDEVYEDALHHWTITKELCENFMGRDSILEKIENYILNITEEPLVLYGKSGHGKTSIMAKAASCVNGWLQTDGRNIQTAIAIRFCGTSPLSSSIQALLPSLCHQIAYTTDRFRHLVPNNYKTLKKYFIDLVTLGEFRGMVVIFLDALNQLSASDGAYSLDWLPAKISKNVKIIVSTLPTDSNILQQLRSKITEEDRYIDIPPLGPKVCGDILECWLRKSGRMLQFRQWQLVREAFEQCSLPLFLDLTYREVLKWKSYQETDQLSLTHSVHEGINLLFDTLEGKYGKVLVSHSLAYLTASGGLSEAEVDDILSLDDEVLNSVYAFWEPPIRRIPPNLWQRIRHDIESYLVEREDAETNVLFWYHQQFREAAEKRYLSENEKCKYVHDIIADYYLGTWSGMKKKPFTYEKSFTKSILERNCSKGFAVRYVPEQPLVYTTFNTQKRFNLRKLNHLPVQLAKAGRIDELKREVFFNYEWLHTKLSACSVQSVIADYNLVDEREINLVGDALRMCESALSVDPDVVGVEMVGRLLPHAAKYDNIQSFIRQCDIAAIRDCPVSPVWQIYTCPGGPLQYICEAEASINSSIDVNIIQSPDRLLLIAKPFYNKRMRVWDITQGEPRLDLELTPSSSVYPTLDGRFINLFKGNRSLQTFRVESGELYGEVAFGHAEIQQMAVGNKYSAFTFKQGVGPMVIDIEARVVLHRFQYQSDTLSISRNDRYLLCNSGQLIAFHEFPLLERKCLIKAPDLPSKFVFHSNSTRFFAMFKNNEVRAYEMDLVRRTNKDNAILHDLEMKDFKVSHTERYLLVRSMRCLYVFDVDEGCEYNLRYRLVDMPPGVFLEKLSTFREAGFTPDDISLVAARHTYLGIWDAKTGQPLRLLQSSVCPIVNLFTSAITNKAITVGKDNSIQVWNLDNLDEDVHHSNLIVKGGVMSLSMSNGRDKVIACGSQYAEARILNLQTGETARNLVHSNEVGKTVLEVAMSPKGRYAVTRCENQSVEEYQKPWKLLREDKLWNVTTGEMLHQVDRSFKVIFSSDDDKIVFFQCEHYSLYDWTVKSFKIRCYHSSSRKVENIQLPEGNIVGEPIIFYSGRYLAVLVQKYGEDEKKNDNGSTQIVLCLYSFEGHWVEIKELTLHDLWSGVHHTDGFLNIRVMNEEHVMVIYMKGRQSLPHCADGTIDLSKPVRKGALVYNFRSSLLVRRLDTCLSEESNVATIHVSSNFSVVMDDRFRFFDMVLNEFKYKMKVASGIMADTATLLLDGKYVAVISETRREIIIFRSSDGKRKARVFVHGRATQVTVGGDDRTLAVGCNDGRIMIFSVLFEHSDPVGEIMDQMPSRRMTRRSYAPDTAILKMDIRNINITQAQLQQLSTTTRKVIEEKRKKPPSFKAVGTGVLLTRQYNRARSKACTIQ